MKIVTYRNKVFVCDICGCGYYSKEECLDCEKSHENKTVMSVLKVEYKKNKEYPDTVTLLMSDGSIRKYRMTKG